MILYDFMILLVLIIFFFFFLKFFTLFYETLFNKIVYWNNLKAVTVSEKTINGLYIVTVNV